MLDFQSLYADVVQGVIAFGILFNIVITIITRIEAQVTRRATEAIGRDVKTLEVNTNSKMDALLAAKQGEADARVVAADAQGQKIGRDEEVARQAAGEAKP